MCCFQDTAQNAAQLSSKPSDTAQFDSGEANKEAVGLMVPDRTVPRLDYPPLKNCAGFALVGVSPLVPTCAGMVHFMGCFAYNSRIAVA